MPSVGQLPPGQCWVSIPVASSRSQETGRRRATSKPRSQNYYGDGGLVRVHSDARRTAARAGGLNGTDQLELRVFAAAEVGQAVLVARLDNLGKGASGAAVQNIKLMLGL